LSPWFNSPFFKFDSEEFQPIGDPGTHRGRIFADAAGEHQRVQSAQGRRESGDIRKKRRARDRSFHSASVKAVCHLWQFVARPGRSSLIGRMKAHLMAGNFQDVLGLGQLILLAMNHQQEFIGLKGGFISKPAFCNSLTAFSASTWVFKMAIAAFSLDMVNLLL
jgi:hypothetical protein